MAEKNIADYNKSCADCAYHHCHQSCFKNKSKKCSKGDGECLFTGEVNRKCTEQRCEHFKQWRPEK